MVGRRRATVDFPDRYLRERFFAFLRPALEGFAGLDGPGV
jgi:hypothetical protein